MVYGRLESAAESGKSEQLGFVFKQKETTFFLGRETIISSQKYPRMALRREKLFALLAKNARSATAYFGIPAGRVVELGEQIEI